MSDDDYYNDYVDDDEEEDDFVPGADDDEDDDQPGGTLPVLDGTISMKDDRLHYEGSSFRLMSQEKPTWNLLDDKAAPADDLVTLTMTGNCDVGVVTNTKPTPRQFKVDILMERSPGKPTDEDKAPAFFYRVLAQQINASGDKMDFQGNLYPGKDNLVCQVYVSTIAPVAAATAAATVPVDDEDDALEEDDLDVNELIALHEDAGMSVEDLRKRYREGGGGKDDDGAKKLKAAPPPVENDDDDDYGF